MKKIVITTTLITVLSISAWAACSTDLDMGGNKVTNVAAPTADTDAATKGYVDDTIAAENAVTPPAGYGVIYAGGHYWLDRNLGATKVCESVGNDTDCYGDLYQWGRLADGHEKRVSGTQAGPTSDIQPGHGNFLTTIQNWLDTNAIYLWSTPGSTNNGICPQGWSVPTVQDFKDLALTNSTDAFSSLKLTESGYRKFDNASIFVTDILGYYWTSTADGDNSQYMSISSTGVSFGSDIRSQGYAVRCVKH